MSLAYFKVFPHNAAERLNKSPLVVVFALVKPKRLFIEIPEQMKRLNVYIGSFQRAFQERPKVFKPVSVDVSFGIALSVIDYVVDVFTRKLVVGIQSIRENYPSPFRHSRAPQRIDMMTAHVLNNLATNARED